MAGAAYWRRADNIFPLLSIAPPLAHQQVRNGIPPDLSTLIPRSAPCNT